MLDMSLIEINSKIMEKGFYRELSVEEMTNCSGGFLPLLLFFGSCLSAGYIFGKDCAERDNRRD